MHVISLYIHTIPLLANQAHACNQHIPYAWIETRTHAHDALWQRKCKIGHLTLKYSPRAFNTAHHEGSTTLNQFNWPITIISPTRIPPSRIKRSWFSEPDPRKRRCPSSVRRVYGSSASRHQPCENISRTRNIYGIKWQSPFWPS